MSKTSDKTREKLLSTMRKTKAGTSADNATAPATKGTAAKKKPAAKKKTPVKKKASKKPKSTAKAKTVTIPRAKGKAKRAAADPYQAAGRIWPD
mgnify:FL=1|jgi:hypothetical protein